MGTTLQVLIKMLKEELQKDSITEYHRMDELGMDSLDTIDVVMRLEERLDVQIGDELLTTFQSMTVGEVAGEVDKL